MTRKPLLSAKLRLLLALAALSPLLLCAQWPFVPPTTPSAQRNALNAVRMQVDWLQNSTRTAANFGAQGYGNVRQQFEGLRGAYGAFKQTLRPDQLAYGANDLAEMDAGLDILQEAFTNYEQDIAEGRPVRTALNDMGQVMRQGSALWWQELNKKASRLRVGWG